MTMLITEMCIYFGWSDEMVLRMPARRFFAMRTKAIAIRRRDLGIEMSLMLEAIVVSGVSSVEHYKEKKNMFREMQMDEQEIKKLKNPYVFDAADPKANNAMAALLGQKA